MMDQDALDWYARYNRYADALLAAHGQRVKVRSYTPTPTRSFVASIQVNGVTIVVSNDGRGGENRYEPAQRGQWDMVMKAVRDLGEQVGTFLHEGYQPHDVVGVLVESQLHAYAQQKATARKARRKS